MMKRPLERVNSGGVRRVPSREDLAGVSERQYSNLGWPR